MKELKKIYAFSINDKTKINSKINCFTYKIYFRNSFVINRLNKKVSQQFIFELLGHRNSNTTSSYYLE